MALRFTKSPEIVNDAGPDRRSAITAPDDPVARGVGVEARQQQQAIVRTIVVNRQVVAADRSQFGNTAGIPSGQFVKRAGDVEQITLGRNLAADSRLGVAGNASVILEDLLFPDE